MTDTPATTRPNSYLFAASFKHAQTTATIDWKWKQVGSDVFEAPSGERVRSISTANKLRGLPRGTRLYLGWRWFEAPDAIEIYRFIAEGRVEIVQPENSNANANNHAQH